MAAKPSRPKCLLRARLSRLGLLSAALGLGGCLVSQAATPQGLYGVVRTIDGQSLTGDIQFGPIALTITNQNGASQITVGQLAGLRFQTPPPRPVPTPVHGLRGTYFKTQNLQGPSVVRTDPIIGFDWTDQKPHPEVGQDNFSVRWEGTIEVPVAGKYLFHIESDDGVRLWIGPTNIIDRWLNQSVSEAKGEIDLEPGKRHALKLEYFEGTGLAVCRLFWTPPGQGRVIVPTDRLFTPPAEPAAAPPQAKEPHGLLGLYFTNTDLSGKFVAVTNTVIDFDWGTGSPRNGIGPDRFSVRWTGRVRPAEAGSYTFHVQTDDGVRLWLDKALLIDRWQDGTLSADTPPIALLAGKDYALRMEMYENGVNAKARLFWSRPNQSRGVVPSQALFPDAAPLSEAVAPDNSTGVLLRGGSFLALPVQSTDESAVRFAGGPTDAVLAATAVARVFLQSLPPHLANRMDPGRTGVLLRNGDFVDGVVREFKQGQVKLSSVLFGRRTFPRDQVLVLALHAPVSSPARFEIHTRNGSRFLVDDWVLEKDQIRVRDTALDGWIIPAAEVVELNRRVSSPGGAALVPGA